MTSLTYRHGEDLSDVRLPGERSDIIECDVRGEQTISEISVTDPPKVIYGGIIRVHTGDWFGDSIYIWVKIFFFLFLINDLLGHNICAVLQFKTHTQTVKMFNMLN